MTVRIAIGSDAQKKLAQRAAARGQDVSAYVVELIHKDIDQPSFAELFAPVHQAVSKSGMTQPEVDSLARKAIAESRKERRKARRTKQAL
jgi:hypothetical protein